MSRSTFAAAAVMLLISATVTAADNQHTKTFIFEIGPEILGDFSTIQGSSVKLTRSDDGVAVRLNTRELLPGAYSVWWVIFNNVEECADWDNTGRCNPFLDLGNPAVGGAVFFAGTGDVVRKTGVGHFQAYLETGYEPQDSAPGLRDKVLISNGGNGLQSPRTAEIHLVMRFHGAAATGQPELLMKQLSTSSGGCWNNSFFVPWDPVEADRIFGCYDPQVAVFLSPLM